MSHIAPIDADISPAQLALMLQIEEMILDGRSSESVRNWAVVDMSCPEPLFNKLRGLISESWRRDGRTVRTLCEIQDETRARYKRVFARAMDKGRLETALRALDSMARLDGLDQPIEINHTVSQITNTSRQKLAELIDKARGIAASRTLKILDGGSPGQVIEAESEDVA